MGILRLGHACVHVLSLDDALRHYTEVLGMRLTGRDEDGAALLKCWDEWDQYSLILRESDQAGLDHIAWKVEHAADLDVLAERVIAAGHPVSDEGRLPGCGRTIRFALPSGHTVYLYHQKDQVGRDVGARNPDPWPDGVPGIGVQWLDHLQLQCCFDPENGINDVARNVAFMRNVLDFSLAEQILVGPEGDQLMAAWMFRTSTPHDIAFAGAARPGFHHLAFYMPAWSDLLTACDVLAKKGVRLEVPPQRHGITRGATCYFFDPSGNRNEVFAGLGYLAQPDMPTTTWTEDRLESGIFYHTQNVPIEFIEAFT